MRLWLRLVLPVFATASVQGDAARGVLLRVCEVRVALAQEHLAPRARMSRGALHGKRALLAVWGLHCFARAAITKYH